MCGITGFIDTSKKHGNGGLRSIVAAMADTLRHRGPDDSGVWVDDHAGVALGHRRLSILDLSPEGHQPMLSAGGRFVIVFNGEIYNHHDLRKELEITPSPHPSPARGEGVITWRGHSDTEVMLAAFERWMPKTAEDWGSKRGSGLSRTFPLMRW